MYSKCFVAVFLIAFVVATASGLVPINPKTRSIGGALSNVGLPPQKEMVLFTFSGEPGVMTYFWLTGQFNGFNRTRIRYYVDGNIDIEFDYYLAAGIGFGDQSVWGTADAGKGAADGSVYFTYQIPFGHSIKITAQMPPDVTSTQNIYFIARGNTYLTVALGRYELPENARMKLYKNENTVLKPLQFLDIYRSSAGASGGAIFQTTLAASSANLNYLEGCVRAFSPPDAQNVTVLLSSGTEDYFQSGWYFNGGAFHFPGAGLTHNQGYNLAAYKFHVEDPIFFNYKGLRISWRNGDTFTPDMVKCIDDNGTPAGDPQVSIVTTYVWAYEW